MGRVAAFIPVRGGSKSIPNKNVKVLTGRPLVHWVIEAALQCPEIDDVFVSSDSDLIKNSIRGIDRRLLAIERPRWTATDEASTELALLDFADHYDFETVVILQATNPQTKAEHLSGALAKMSMENADSLVSVTRQHIFLWSEKSKMGIMPFGHVTDMRPRRQEWTGHLVENGAFYITSKEALLKSQMRFSGKIIAYEMPRQTAFELDEPGDWPIVERLMRTQYD